MRSLLLITLLFHYAATLVYSSSPIGLHYTNWDGLQVCTPITYLLPRSEAELIYYIQNAMRSNETVKVVGSGLSFSGVQMANEGGNMIALNHYNKIVKVSPYNTTATTTFNYGGHGVPASGDALVEVQAGAELRTLVQELDEEYGLAMVNLGATATQSIVGASATGTHGTGTAIGNLASQIVEMRIIDATGRVHVASKTHNIELFHAAQVGIGAIGIISTVTLHVVPQWKLHLRQIPISLTELFSNIDELLLKYDRLQWSFTPYTDDAKVIVRESVPWDSEIYPPAPDGGCWSTTQATYTAQGCVDVSYKALTDSATHYATRTLYTEMEMFIPVEHTMAAVADYITYMDRIQSQHDPSVTVSVMIRYVAGRTDEAYMSPVVGRDSAVISVIVLGNETSTGSPAEFELYASGLEELCSSKYAGRPHWGKVNYATTDDIRVAYSSSSSSSSSSKHGDGGASLFDRFVSVMHTMDPAGMFMNEYINQRFL